MPQLPLRAAPVRAYSDDDLMLLARAGENAAFDVLVKRHHARVLCAASRHLGDPSLAPDVAQRAFVELFHARERYQAGGSFVRYLSRIVLNQCRMVGRSEKRHRAIDITSIELAVEDEDRMAAEERRRGLTRALPLLSRPLREVIVLRYLADLTLEQTARMLHVPVGTVKSRNFSALAKLRELIGSVG